MISYFKEIFKNSVTEISLEEQTNPQKNIIKKFLGIKKIFFEITPQIENQVNILPPLYK